MIAEVEKNARAAHATRDFAGMTEVILRGYGGEVLGFLISVHGSVAAAVDAGKAFCTKGGTGFHGTLLPGPAVVAWL